MLALSAIGSVLPAPDAAISAAAVGCRKTRSSDCLNSWLLNESHMSMCPLQAKHEGDGDDE